MQPKLAITTAVLAEETAGGGAKWPPLIERCVNSWSIMITSPSCDIQWVTHSNFPHDNLGVTGSLQWLYEHTTAPIIAFLHSDCEILEQGWDERVLREFDDPEVGLVGFGGGLQHGSDDIYKTPYQLQQLARFGYLSNTTDAESHGTRFTSSCDVAVLDGFCLVVRRGLLDRVGGWPVKSLPFHSYDYWAAITAHKLVYRVRMVGVGACHHGGTTSTTPEYQDWCQRVLGKTDAQVHEESHKFIYDYGRGYLPWRCP